MTYIRLDEIPSGTLDASDAASLALAVAGNVELLHPGDVRAVPSITEIKLNEDGSLDRVRVTRLAQTDDVARLAQLVVDLLGLDVVAGARPDVPGPLLVALSRALRQIDLPPPTWEGFLQTLRRYGDGDQATLRTLFARLAPPAVTVPAASPALHDPDLRPTDDPDVGSTELHFATVQPTPVRQIRIAGLGETLLGTAAGLLLALLVAQQGWLSTSRLPVPEKRSADESPAAKVAARTPAPLGAGADAFSPSFSPEGREVLFHKGRAAAPLMRASLTPDGRIDDAVRVLDDGAANYHPVLSPDGRWLAFDSDRSGARAVYIMPAGGGAPRRISGSREASVPSWAPDGRRVAFVEADRRRARTTQVWIADIVTGTRRQVTNHRVGTPWGASWFPDGKRIAYSREDRLVIADLENPTQTWEVISPRPGQLIRTPAVSPDGNQIVFQVFRDGAWMYDLRTQRLTRILDDPTAEEFVWTKDGRGVAYHARDKSGWSLWTLRVGT